MSKEKKEIKKEPVELKDKELEKVTGGDVLKARAELKEVEMAIRATKEVKVCAVRGILR